MLKKKNAQGMSIKIIIVAIIGLIILAAVVMMLSGKLGAFGGGLERVGDPLKKCLGTEAEGGQGGSLTETVGELCDSEKVQIASSDSLIKGLKCCKKI